MMADQEQSVLEQLEAMGFSIESTCTESGDYTSQNKWVVKISLNGYFLKTTYFQGAAHRRFKCHTEIGKQHERIPQRYLMGGVTLHVEAILLKNTEPTPPALDDVLHCLVMDASCVRHGQSFADFAMELGYDEDSIKDKAVFEACRDIWSDLSSVLRVDFDALEEVFQDF